MRQCPQRGKGVTSTLVVCPSVVAATALLRPFLLRQPELVHAVLEDEEPAKSFPAQVGVVTFEDRPDVVGRFRGVEFGVDLFEEFPRHLLWHLRSLFAYPSPNFSNQRAQRIAIAPAYRGGL